MATAKHTPGPWEIRRDTWNEPTMPFGEFKDVKRLQVGSGKGTLEDPFHIVHSTYDNGAIDADTRLIAAAPELLEACKDVAGWLATWDVPRDLDGAEHWIPKLQDAIAKAEAAKV